MRNYIDYLEERAFCEGYMLAQKEFGFGKWLKRGAMALAGVGLAAGGYNLANNFRKKQAVQKPLK